MKVIKSITAIRKLISSLKKQNKKIGFVPTMGSLHEGHLSLIRKARQENDIVILSIFVNPVQFGPQEDFKKYPREEKKDKLLAKQEKVDIIFYPTVEEMYPKGYLTYVDVEEITEHLCGKFREGHFKGVVTVVVKLLNIVNPDVFYLGQKDAQQAIILKKMVADLNMTVKVKICPTVREADGLAMSSRNCHLNDEQRQEALVLFKALKTARVKILAGEIHPQKLKKLMKNIITQHSSAKIQYIECVDVKSLEPLVQFKNKIMIAIAVKFGKIRLIDNIIFHLK